MVNKTRERRITNFSLSSLALKSDFILAYHSASCTNLDVDVIAFNLTIVIPLNSLLSIAKLARYVKLTSRICQLANFDSLRESDYHLIDGGIYSL